MSQSVTETSPSSEQQSTIPQNQSHQQQKQSNETNDYERSVTEKENMLMSGFNKLNLNNGNGLNNNLLETNNNLNLLNGKETANSSDLILHSGGGDGNNGVVATNGHDKGSIENTL